MTTPDSQEKIKEEAKAIRLKVDSLIKDTDEKERMIRLICIYGGLLTETLMEYEEPDVVMEQAFHRIADLLRTDPAESFDDQLSPPPAYKIDHDTEIGRQLGRGVAHKLPKGLDDIHEIAIALVINDFPVWEKNGFPREKLLRLLVESVIASLTYEMAAQDFCDLLIEEFIAEQGRTPAQAIYALAAVSGTYLVAAEAKETLPPDAEKELTNVMAREAVRHGTPGIKNWSVLAAANDLQSEIVPEYVNELKPSIEEFFELIGLEEALGKAVAVAKAVGRMVAVITVEDVGQIHPSIAKSLAKTGMILGTRYREGA